MGSAIYEPAKLPFGFYEPYKSQTIWGHCYIGWFVGGG